jgi:two-component system chemotaxis response regulator CheV
VNEDYDELDLVELVSSNANENTHYLVFVGSDNQYYAKNVSKIEELLVYKDLQIAKNNNESLIIGTADIRSHMTSLFYFDEWIGNKVLEESEYELVIVAKYAEHRFGIIVKKVEYIVNIPAGNMQNNQNSDEKAPYIAKVRIGNEMKMCLLVDSDKMLADVFSCMSKKSSQALLAVEKITSEKRVLIADDSRYMQGVLEELMQNLGLKYKIFGDGKQLVDDLNKEDIDNIALIITDLEMPVLSGRGILEYIKSSDSYKDIPVLINTNMNNNSVEADLLQLGACKVVNKLNIESLVNEIKDILLK